MSKHRHRKRTRLERPERPRGRRTALIAATVLLAVGILAVAVLFLRGERGRTILPPASSAAQGTPPAAVAVAASSGFRALNGRWLRPDGGYILEIRDVDAGGKIEAVYLNPAPITVARAEATRDGSTLKVFVELRAPGYPGSTYTLTYDPKRDQLAGVYFQAALRQSFDVVFVRMK
jgi:hypothetical protein